MYGHRVGWDELGDWNWRICTCCCLVAKVMSDSVTPWTIAHQAPLSMGFPRQGYRSGLPLPSPGNLPDPGVKPTSPALADRFFMTEPPRKPMWEATKYQIGKYERFSYFQSLLQCVMFIMFHA